MNVDPSIANALRDLKNRRSVIDHAIEALEALTDGRDAQDVDLPAMVRGPVPPHHRVLGRRSPGNGAGGAAGVEKVLRASPGKGFNAQALADAMFANGWETDADDPARAARAAANRLRRHNPAEFYLERGKFYCRAAKAAGEAGVQTRFSPQTSPPSR